MQLRNKFWIYSGLYLAIILHYLVVNGLRILPPSSSDESFKINPTASLNVNRSLSTLPQRSLENVNQTVSHSTLITTNKETGKEISTKYARGRSIVSSLSEQASNFGKGLLNFFRGSPPSHWRPPLPHPSVLRPYPHLQRRPPKGPMPHFNPAPPGMGDTDRVGPTFLGGPFQGGFLPSKKIFGLNPIKSSSSSTLINTTKVMLVDPKAPCDFYTDSLCIESYPYPE